MSLDEYLLEYRSMAYNVCHSKRGKECSGEEPLLRSWGTGDRLRLASEAHGARCVANLLRLSKRSFHSHFCVVNKTVNTG